ncbi:MAG: alpha/beta fold hydrolase [Bacteroidales bacterium]|nr:alpha/beta fold hydrolase [Candidatus Cryptobacteroides aphodequi]
MIICHGLTGHKDELHLTTLADSLQSYGVASVRFDFNGHGEYDTPFSQHTLAKEMDDLQVIFDYVSSLPWVDTGRIGLTGHSQGGAVAGMKAGELGADKVKCLALLSPAACIHTYALQNTFLGFDLPKFEEMPDSISFVKGLSLNKEYFRVAREMDIHALTAPYSGPVCLLQGDADMPTLYTDALRYKDYLPQMEMFIREGYDHCYTSNVSEALVPAIHFLVDNLK